MGGTRGEFSVGTVFLSGHRPRQRALRPPPIAANAMLCAVNQAAYLLRRQLESQGRTFLSQGGFTEALYAARVRARRPNRSDQSDQSDRSDNPSQ
jgi:four helix bundle suffix protein